jgi:hypothetical protein
MPALNGFIKAIADMKIGRNEPCPCGSGKKYKHCHLASDEQQQRASRKEKEAAEAVEAEGNDLSMDFSMPDEGLPRGMDPRQTLKFLDQLSHQGSGKDQAELQQLLAKNQHLIDYVQRQEEIDAALEALDSHSSEFEELAQEEEGLKERIQELFEEEPFDKFRFTKEEVARALEKHGQRRSFSSDQEEEVKVLRAVIRELVNKERRTELSIGLWLELPAFVNAGRYVDAAIIARTAENLQEQDDELDPFLIEMMASGYDEWAGEKRNANEAILREIGLDPVALAGMGHEEIRAQLKMLDADPVQSARLREVMLHHPEVEMQGIENLKMLERQATALLTREDVDELLLTFDEIEASLPDFQQRIETIASLAPDLSSMAGQGKLGADHPITIALRDLISDITQRVFSPERITQLVGQLKCYRDRRLAEGDKHAALVAEMASLMLENEKQPELNPFLCNLSFTSLRLFSEPA